MNYSDSSSAQQAEQIRQPDPVKMLKKLHASGGGLSKKEADAYLAYLYEERKVWGGEDSLVHS